MGEPAAATVTEDDAAKREVKEEKEEKEDKDERAGKEDVEKKEEKYSAQALELQFLLRC